LGPTADSRRTPDKFPIGTDKAGNVVTGFYAGRTHQIIPNTECALGVPVNQEILEMIVDFMNEYHVPAYEEETGRGLLRHMLIRYGFTTKEIMVNMNIKESTLKYHNRNLYGKLGVSTRKELLELHKHIKSVKAKLEKVL
jgi:DNA-binding CsgD family transcriptional regulator